jgi:hypothetical protein
MHVAHILSDSERQMNNFVGCGLHFLNNTDDVALFLATDNWYFKQNVSQIFGNKLFTFQVDIQDPGTHHFPKK